MLAETLGSPRLLFTIVVVFALYAFHRDSPQELGIIIATWVLTALISPLEGSVRLFRRIRRIWRPNIILDADGEAVAYQTPSLILVRQTSNSKTEPGGFLAIKDPIGKPRLALALDHVGRDEGILLRTLESTDVEIPAIIEQQLSSLSSSLCGCDWNRFRYRWGWKFAQVKNFLGGHRGTRYFYTNTVF